MFKANVHLLKALFLIGILFSSCSKNDENSSGYSEQSVNLTTHTLRTYSVIKNSKYLIVCESGLGDGHESWNPSLQKSEVLQFSTTLGSDVLIYDRAGYGKSGIDNHPRDISTLRSELEKVISHFAHGRKVILIGHSLGGMIIRDYAIKNPDKTAALLFIDSMHEGYNNPALEDSLYELVLNAYGANFGATREARELAEDIAYGASLPNLPNVPVAALTSMRIDASSDYADTANNATRQQWYQAHESLGAGLTDFTHIATTHSGHYIHHDEPELVVQNIKLLLSKLP